jgi:hypothetical protein
MQVKEFKCATFNVYYIPNLYIASLLVILNRKIKCNNYTTSFFREKRDACSICNKTFKPLDILSCNAPEIR